MMNNNWAGMVIDGSKAATELSDFDREWAKSLTGEDYSTDISIYRFTTVEREVISKEEVKFFDGTAFQPEPFVA
jgi:hypothetical protein